MLSFKQSIKKIAATKTGHERVTLRPGRSLMDWIQLTSCRCNVTKSRQGISHTELAKHGSVEDCWVLLGERVYDVTEYLEYHPGGVKQLMRVAGSDGTALFNEYHPWVNYSVMLKSCLVGTFNGDRSQLPKPKPAPIDEATNSDANGFDFEAAEIKTDISANHLRISCSKWKELKDENISLEFEQNTLKLLLHYHSGTTDSLRWYNIPKSIFDKSFHASVDDGTILVGCKVDDSEFDVVKQWAAGTYYTNIGLEYRKCYIHQMYNVTHNICSMILRMPSFCRLMVPIGHHIRLRISVNGSLIERPYTPVSVSEDGQYISLMIKFYENGIFTTKLRDRKCGDCVEISNPLGCFNAWSECVDNVLMLAAGSGLAPMLRLATSRLNNKKMTTMLIFNRTIMDILPNDYFEKCNISLKHQSLKVIHCLSEPEPHWNGERGLISKDLISKYADVNVEQKGYGIFVCGPDPFVNLAIKLLDDLKVPQENIYIFQN